MARRLTFEGVLVFRTARAILFQSHYWAGPLWFPLSQLDMEIDGEFDEPGRVIHVKPWLPEKKGLEEFTEYDEEAIERMAQV